MNLMLASGKLFAGIAGHSHALVADGVESLADLFSSAIVWRGLVIAEAPPDEDHPYGHGKAEPIASALVAGTLIMAAGWIAIQAIQEITKPKAAPAPFTLIVLLAVIIIKEGLFRFVNRESTHLESSVMRTDAWHHRSDAITSLAAGVGITVALIGGPGYESADGIAALLGASIIAWNGWALLRPSLDELMDASLNPDLREHIQEIANTIPGVANVEKCLVRKMGRHYFVDMHMQVAPEMTVLAAHDIAHQVKDKVRTVIPAVKDVLVHIEPVRK